MRKLKKQKSIKFIILITFVLSLMSVGYASLNTNLKIVGTAHIAKTVWSVYFSNVVPSANNNVVQVITAPTAVGKATELNWQVSMDTPGQVYEFTVDVVNDGTIDAMIETAAEELLNQSLTTAQKKYLDCTITYINGAEIERYDRLAAGETKTLKVKLEFKTGVAAEDLPQSAETITLSYDINYIRADENAVTKKTSMLKIGDEVDYTTALNGVTLDNWKVFYVDGDYTYIILDDYLPNSAIDTNQTYFNKLSKNGEYSIYASNEAGTTDFERKMYLLNAMSQKSNWDSLLTGTINGHEVNETRSEYVFAMGAPDIELWKNSWNEKYPEDIIYTRFAENIGNTECEGWYIGLEENPNGTFVSLSEKAGYNNTLYFPYKARIDSNRCRGYWLASPASSNPTHAMIVNQDGGTIKGDNYYYNYVAFRPVISLPTSVVNQ